MKIPLKISFHTSFVVSFSYLLHRGRLFNKRAQVKNSWVLPEQWAVADGISRKLFFAGDWAVGSWSGEWEQLYDVGSGTSGEWELWGVGTVGSGNSRE